MKKTLTKLMRNHIINKKVSKFRKNRKRKGGKCMRRKKVVKVLAGILSLTMLASGTTVFADPKSFSGDDGIKLEAQDNKEIDEDESILYPEETNEVTDKDPTYHPEDDIKDQCIGIDGLLSPTPADENGAEEPKKYEPVGNTATSSDTGETPDEEADTDIEDTKQENNEQMQPDEDVTGDGVSDYIPDATSEIQPDSTDENEAEDETALEENQESIPNDKAAENTEEADTKDQCIGVDGVEAPNTMMTYGRTATTPGKWIKSSNGKWWYKHNNGSYTKSGFEFINGKWYLFDKDGWMLIKWQKAGDSAWYWLGENADDGAMRSGWQKVYGYWYYLGKPDQGWMRIKWQKVDNKWYWFGSNPDSGSMKIGWQKIDEHWYWLGNSKDSGYMRIGWQKVDNKWYWLGSNPDDGRMLIKWQLINGKWYWLGDSQNTGYMRTGWQEIGGKRYWLGSADSGYMRTGWVGIQNYTYYLEPNTGVMVTGKHSINGKMFYFAPTGAQENTKEMSGSKIFGFSNDEGLVALVTIKGAMSEHYVDNQNGTCTYYDRDAFLSWTGAGTSLGLVKVRRTEPAHYNGDTWIRGFGWKNENYVVPTGTHVCYSITSTVIDPVAPIYNANNNYSLRTNYRIEVDGTLPGANGSNFQLKLAK